MTWQGGKEAVRQRTPRWKEATAGHWPEHYVWASPFIHAFVIIHSFIHSFTICAGGVKSKGAEARVPGIQILPLLQVII